MRKMIVPGAVLLWVAVFMAAVLNPLNVKTGLWNVTMTSKISTLPSPTTNTYQSCVKKEDLDQYPFTDPKDNCNWKVLSSTGSEMEATGTCKPEGMGNVSFNMKLVATDSENVKGTGQLAFNGPAGAINGTYSGTAKWVGAMCPAGVK
jgi:Protein of unknown function (DUF3617)